MFDIFNKKKIKDLEEDIKTLYKVVEGNLDRIKYNQIFGSFCTNRAQIDKIREYYLKNPFYGLTHTPEPCYENVSIKTVLEKLLKKMNLQVHYEPERKTPFTIRLKKER